MTKCHAYNVTGTVCKLREGCQRYTTRSLVGQSYFADAPFTEGVNEQHECHAFWPELLPETKGEFSGERDRSDGAHRD